MLSRQWRLWRLGWRHPAVPRVVVVAFLLGGLGGMIPTGFLVLSTGAGVGRGVTWALWVFAFTSPLLVAYAVSALCAARYEFQVDADMFLASQPSASTLIRDGLGATSIAMLLTLPAAAGGAIVGIADAAARHTSVWTAISPQAVLAALAASCWWSLLTVLVVAGVRSAAMSLFIVCGFFLAGVAALGLADAQATWDILSVSPFAPFTLVASDVVADRNGLVTHGAPALLGCVVWPVVIGSVVWWRQRGLIPKLPSRSV